MARGKTMKVAFTLLNSLKILSTGNPTMMNEAHRLRSSRSDQKKKPQPFLIAA
jgi:hypothetical protein